MNLTYTPLKKIEFDDLFHPLAPAWTDVYKNLVSKVVVSFTQSIVTNF